MSAASNANASVEPIPEKLRAAFLARVRAYENTHAFRWDPVRVILTIYHTGMHPSILVHARSHRLRVVDITRPDGVEDQEIAWDRTKPTQTSRKHISMAIAPDLRPWIAEFIRSLPPEPTASRVIDPRDGSARIEGKDNGGPYHQVRWVPYKVKDPRGAAFPKIVKWRKQDFCYLPITHLVTTVCDELEFEGTGPRTMRHTLADFVYTGTGRVDEIQAALGVNATDALLYARRNAADMRFGKLVAERKA